MLLCSVEKVLLLIISLESFAEEIQVLISLGDKTRVTRILHLDPNGSIPAMVVNNAVSVVTKVVKYFLESVQ